MSPPTLRPRTDPYSMTVVVDFEESQHYLRTEEIQRNAFGRGDELIMLRRARKHEDVRSMIATVSGIVFGHTLYYPSANVEAPYDYPVELGGIGPVAVDPSQQGRGIGRRLIEEALLEAKADGFDAMVADGLNAFWRKLGFRPAIEFNIHFKHASEDSEFGIYWLNPPYHSSDPVVVDYPDCFQYRA